MEIAALDWAIIGAYFLLALGVGIWASRVVGNSATGFFLAGRNMPWWLLGISMVATTFSTDTPNLVTGLVREQGVSGNWGMVGLFAHRHAHRFRVRSAVAPIGRDDGHRIL